MDNVLAVRYTAHDGQEIELTADIVSRYILTGNAQATDAEIAGFLQVCKARGLNPLARDAYLVKYGQNSPASTIVSKDYYNRMATEQPTYDGFDAGVVVMTPNGETDYRDGALVGYGEVLLGGWATVYDKGRSHPVKAVVGLNEYSTGKALWGSKPATMIRKVAFVQALREAYPATFQGLYDESEMPDLSFSEPIPIQPIEAPQSLPQQPSDPRTQLMRELSAELIQAMDIQPTDTARIADVKRQLMESGDYRTMDETQWARYVTNIRNTIAAYRSIQNAVSVTDSQEYTPQYDVA